MTFNLHANFSKKIFIDDLPLCRVLLEDEKNYPWLLLIPRRPQVLRIIDLTEDDQWLLMKELHDIQKLMWEEFHPTQLNVAAIGNKTPQLHIHVIARYDTDPAWPNTVWDHPVRAVYDEEMKAACKSRLQLLLSTRRCRKEE